MPGEPTRLGRWRTGCGRSAVVALVAAILVGCGTLARHRVDVTGPPPDGYEHWDDYWDAQDQMQLEAERLTTRQGISGPISPISPR